MAAALRDLVLAVLVAAACASCAAGDRAPIVQPGSPGSSSRTITPAEATDVSRIQPTAADIRFMQRMIGHHAQALEMTALVPSRTPREAMHLLSRRLEVSQADEIRFMGEWLQSRGQSVPDSHAHHTLTPSELMPGMLVPDEMVRLAAASGAEFERLFLEGMIKHHEGALVMVQELLATPASGQEPELFAFAADVEADQRIEIERMRGMLDARQ